jgi:D-alanyl-D-alanine carboxypeptidase (penicillin-binding protein 5/6)
VLGAAMVVAVLAIIGSTEAGRAAEPLVGLRPSAADRPAPSPSSLAPEVPPSTPEAIGDGVVLDDPPAAWIVVDEANGAVLAGRDEHELLRPASLSKLLTALVVVRHLAPGSEILTPPQVRRVPPLVLGMTPGQAWPLRTVLHGLLLRSDNDAAVALAVAVAGSERGFAPMLEREAHRLGIDDGAIFQDPAGLDTAGSIGGGNLASPADIAVIARAVLANPELARIVSERSWSGPGPDGMVHLTSIDDLLWTYPGAIGLKTGFTDEAQWTLAGAARRGDQEVVCVEMDVAQDELWSDAAALLNLGFWALGHPGGPELPGAGGYLPALPAHRSARAAAGETLGSGGVLGLGGSLAGRVAGRGSGGRPPGARSSEWPLAIGGLGVVALGGLGLVASVRRRQLQRRRAERRRAELGRSLGARSR